MFRFKQSDNNISNIRSYAHKIEASRAFDDALYLEVV